MTHEQAFLDAIIENPSDDTPRLVFADWLEEHGQEERAEFIRVQYEIAMREAYAGTSERERFWSLELKERMNLLRRRQQELLCHENVEKWGRVDCFGDDLEYVASPVTNYNFQPPKVSHGVWAIYEEGCGAVPKIDFNFRRGFIAEVTLTCDDWMRHGPELVKATPLEDVRLSDKEPRNFRLDVTNASSPFEQYIEEWGWSQQFTERPHPSIADWLITPSIFKFLKCGREAGEGAVIIGRVYPSREAAQNDLSQACLTWARSQTTEKLPRVEHTLGRVRVSSS